jgi:mRNA interferase MazF
MVKQGDIITIDLDPTKGHEQAGYRPVVVVSNTEQAQDSGLTLICPITGTDRKSPLHVAVKAKNTAGFVMCDNIRAVDLSSRKYKTVDVLEYDALWDVCDIIKGAVSVLEAPYVLHFEADEDLSDLT